jgi:hypothetical protein
MQNETITAKLSQLQDNPAQCRTLIQAWPLAELALQVYTDGVSPHHPFVVADNGDGSYRLVSGHRLRNAALLAEEIKKQRGAENGVTLFDVWDVLCDVAGTDQEVIVCDACNTIAEVDDRRNVYCRRCESWVDAHTEIRKFPDADTLPDLHQVLANRGDAEVPVVLYEGSPKEEILMLQQANAGGEKPDLLGLARSFAAAVEAGATPEEIATANTIPESRVSAILMLNCIPADLARAIADGDMALGVARELSRLKGDELKLDAAAEAIRLRGGCYVEQVAKLVSTLQNWETPVVPLDPEMAPRQRNGARLIAALWAKTLSEDPARAWLAVARGALHHRGMCVEFLSDASLSDLLYELVPEARCETCQLREQLKRAPFGLWHNKYPCQTGDDEVKCCGRAVGPSDPYVVRVPYDWSGYPGVERTGYSERACFSAEDFDRAIEAALAPEDEKPGRDDSHLYDLASHCKRAYPKLREPKNVAEQRALIADYMARHATFSGASHWFATCCETCQHKLEESPVKSKPDAPHCAWAHRRRKVQFGVRKPVEEGQGPVIPLCRQYKPSKCWDELIPDHPTPPPNVTREWMKNVITHLVEHVERENRDQRTYVRMMCEHLTGRPELSRESHLRWLFARFEEKIGNLSDAQLWTLVLGITAEWERDRAGYYDLCLSDGRIVRYVDEAWRTAGEAEAKEGEEPDVDEAEEVELEDDEDFEADPPEAQSEDEAEATEEDAIEEDIAEAGEEPEEADAAPEISENEENEVEANKVPAPDPARDESEPSKQEIAKPSKVDVGNETEAQADPPDPESPEEAPASPCQGEVVTGDAEAMASAQQWAWIRSLMEELGYIGKNKQNTILSEQGFDVEALTAARAEELIAHLEQAKAKPQDI